MNAEKIFKQRCANPKKLAEFGFSRKEDGDFTYSVPVLNGRLVLTVLVTGDGVVDTVLKDPQGRHEYVVERSSSRVPWRILRKKDRKIFMPDDIGYDESLWLGKMLKADAQDFLTEVAVRCFDPDVFHGELTQQVIAYVKKTYGDDLEFLWADSPDCAIWRRKTSGKWYGILMQLPENKLIPDSERIVDVLNLHLPPEDMPALIDGHKFFPGYHMNKKHWYSIRLDGSVTPNEIFTGINVSYALAGREKKRRK